MPEDTRHNQSGGLTPSAYMQLLRVAVRAARAGNKTGARTLLRVLTREQPEDARAWLWLAGVAETSVEQRFALEQAVALDPDHQLAKTALERVRARSAETAPATPPDPASPEVPAAAVPPPYDEIAHAPAQPEAKPRVLRRWLYALIVGGIVVVIWAMWRDDASQISVGRLGLSTPTLPGQSPLRSENEENKNAATVTLPVVRPDATDVPMPTITALQATPTAPALVALGEIIEQDDWQITLPRREYVQVINEGVGNVQPRGQFVLILLSVSNTSDTPRQFSVDVVQIIDAQGRRYAPNVSASRQYLETYGRGTRGDLTLQDTVPSGGGVYSVPLLFDIPTNVTQLILTPGDAAAEGWRILDE